MFLRFFMAQVQSTQAAPGAAPSVEMLIAHLEKTPDVRHYLLENIFQELTPPERALLEVAAIFRTPFDEYDHCLLYTSDAADERPSVDLGGRRIIKKKNTRVASGSHNIRTKKI